MAAASFSDAGEGTPSVPKFDCGLAVLLHSLSGFRLWPFVFTIIYVRLAVTILQTLLSVFRFYR